MSSGKWYAEATITTIGAESSVGIAKDTQDTGGYVGAGAFSYGYYLNGQKYNNATGSAYGASYTSGDVIGVAFDADAGNLVFYKNGVSQGTAFTGLTNGPYVFEGQGRSATSGNQNDWNFGQQAWKYAPPSGFKALCTTNLPIPSIKNSSTFFDAITYNGTGTTFVSPSGLKFAPNLVWVKSRSQNISNVLSDTVRGTGEVLCSNNTRAGSPDSFLTNFNQDGFTLNNSITANNSGSTYVAWCWSKNSVAGMDIVSYTGTGANMTINHSLGAIPKMIINKSRSAVGGWPVYHASLGNTGALQLESSGAFSVSNLYWNNTSPTASDFTVNAGLATNGTTYINYLFAEIDGYSKFGSYTGNGSTDGPFVWCGFRPKYILIKTTGASYNWWIIDTARGSANVVNNVQFADLAATDYTTAGVEIDIISSGFKIRNTNGGDNGSSVTYIFAAFAEYPFKYARAR
jgi:hypothetical protein